MIKFLKPLYETLYVTPETMNEIAFHQGFKSDLLEAWDWCLRYLETKNDCDINQAWDIYFAIFKKLSKRLKEVTFYDLKNVSPHLLSLNSTAISVPGMYKNDRALVTISGFSPTLEVLRSK
jgi:FKBP12-rapamycin complex-associated protein